MKFTEGAKIGCCDYKEKCIILRYPKKGDYRSFMRFINALIGEKAIITANKKIGMKEEKAWVDAVIAKSKKGDEIMICAEAEDNIVAGISLRRGMGAKRGTAILGISVAKEYRKLGLGSIIFGMLEKLGKEAGIETIESSFFSNNKASEKFHKKMGFKPVGRVPKSVDYYGKRVDEIFVYKKIK